ncbi:ribonuclease H-like domain-containing protein [Rhizophagus clarus]|uniref:Ribonuclease H-like domain-containing protein n=2 Tax=Rhizophagus clarus TaxID=94130 RepID=A0A8H3LLC5_9GLOM|nr:ribonuclease H-like domain-containing protein [Rhizophagus clarus]
MIDRLKTRWKSWEQPLLLLSWLLHPKYKMTKFKDNVPNLNHVYLSKWLIYYYEAWAKTKSRSILCEFESYRKGLYPFDEQTINQFENNILSYWELHYEKALKMSKLCASISFQHRINEAKAIQQQKVKENIAEPIIPNDEENLNLETENENQNSDDGEDIEENNESQITSNWNNLINMWDQLLLQEKVAEEQAETESDLEIDNDVEINDFLLDKTHPALDNNAKWDIENIFIDNLDAPFLTDENILN